MRTVGWWRGPYFRRMVFFLWRHWQHSLMVDLVRGSTGLLQWSFTCGLGATGHFKNYTFSGLSRQTKINGKAKMYSLAHMKAI